MALLTAYLCIRDDAGNYATLSDPGIDRE
jgi:hypothetical protein